jgi:hypothetical protein
MNVTKEVIKDLLRLCHEGEASADTRRLVEGYLANDAELREQAAAAAAIRPRMVKLQPEPDQALATMEQTKRAVTRQKWMQFFAILFTMAPFSFFFKDGQLEYAVIRDAPLSLIPLWGAAIVFWFCYLRSRRVVTSA